MFFHMFIYRLKFLVRVKEEFFWNMIFPLILGTCFFLAFKNITGGSENFDTIPVAVVMENTQENTYFKVLMDSLTDQEEQTAFFNASYVSQEEANTLLESGDVEGIIAMDAGMPKLVIAKSGMKQTMIKSVLDKYIQVLEVLKSADYTNPGQMAEVMDTLLGEKEVIRELKLTDGNTDNVVDYFFSLIAMTCLMGTMSGADCCLRLKANMSQIGLRKSISPTPKYKMVLADVLATYTMLAAADVILLVYLKYILCYDIGSKMGFILLTSLVGSLIALSFGILIGSLKNKSEGTKMGICTIFTLVSSFLSGLMVGGIKYALEKSCPIVNRINPATLISDALHSLNIYDDYHKYTICMVTMLVMSVIVLTFGILSARRESYDSL